MASAPFAFRWVMRLARSCPSAILTHIISSLAALHPQEVKRACASLPRYVSAVLLNRADVALRTAVHELHGWLTAVSCTAR